MSTLPTWAICSIAAAALLSPVFAFLIAIGVELLIGSLMDAGALLLLPLAAAGTLAWFLLRVRALNRQGKASAHM